MNSIELFFIILVVLFVLAEIYFKLADKYNIIDKPNERSSHDTVVIRGGGTIFSLSVLVWFAWKIIVNNQCFEEYGMFVLGLILIAGVSFIDDIKSLPDSVRLLIQIAAIVLIFYQLGIMHFEYWWIVILSLIVYVGATNIINFMDGINGITGSYALANLIPLALLNRPVMTAFLPQCTMIPPQHYVHQSLIYTVIIADLVFCYYNFRPKGKAKCFAGDVGSIGIAFILLFLIGKLILKTQDPTYLIFLIVYGFDGFLTICHRVMLHENLGQAHRKHAYQLMANELKMSHITVSLFYALLQLIISLVFIYLVPNTITAHVIYLVSVSAILTVAYLLFMKKYYHLHEEYLATLKK